MVLDAVGSEIWSFTDLVKLIAEAVGRRPKLIHVQPDVALFLANLAGKMVGDIMLTREEIMALMANLLASSQAPPAQCFSASG